jgi:hypothetical protein
MVCDVSTELAVMQSVGNALAQLPDAQSRARVLRWAANRVWMAAEVATPSASARRAAADPGLSVDGLSDLFPEMAASPRRERDAHPDLQAAGGLDLNDSLESLDTLIKGLAAELGQFAIDWQHA